MGKLDRPMFHTQIAFLPCSISSSSHRSRQSSLEVDRDNHGLLKSTPTVHSTLSTTETDKGFVKTVKSLRQRLHGWRFGVLLASAMATFVLVVNCLVAIIVHSKYGTDDGLSTAFEGDCRTANQWSLALHIAINILSSLLLSASNYTMQVLNAPTRAECDIAHAQGDWLDIGITSLRNIARVTWPRRVLLLLLGFSSVPIHLLYNSAAFKTIDANAYVVVVTTPVFLQSDAFLSPQINETSFSSSEYAFNISESLRQAYFTHEYTFVNLSAAECIKIYGVDFVTGHSDVIAVIAEQHPANPSFRAVIASEPKVYSTSVDSYAWYASPSPELPEPRGCLRKPILARHQRHTVSDLLQYWGYPRPRTDHSLGRALSQDASLVIHVAMKEAI